MGNDLLSTEEGALSTKVTLLSTEKEILSMKLFLLSTEKRIVSTNENIYVTDCLFRTPNI
ncbi:hypothetical protein [Rummeliibacillus sp. SL167]|uniref:hypothetical protein n=1 Tax=Rummeliibacillus sp. SL167 TaxID=2579792 RepID=UPI0011B4E9E0|nr:hypothetical protein [Rummeliibacillus sp. SL167]